MSIESTGSSPGDTDQSPDLFQPGQTPDPPPVPPKPVFLSPCDITTEATDNEFIQFDVVVSGSEGRVITLQATAQPPGSAIYIGPPGNPTDATVSWSTQGAAPGNYYVTFVATDDLGNQKTCTRTITIAAPPTPTGACCITVNGTPTPSIRTEAQCYSLGGTYYGDGSVIVANICNTTPPPQPKGVCCVSGAPTADLKTRAECDALGGFYKGDGTTEVSGICDQPTPATTGACCIGGVGYVLTAAECSSNGGTYYGDGSAVTAGLCTEDVDEHIVGTCACCNASPTVDATSYPAPSTPADAGGGSGSAKASVALAGGPIVVRNGVPVRLRATVFQPEE